MHSTGERSGLYSGNSNGMMLFMVEKCHTRSIVLKREMMLLNQLHDLLLEDSISVLNCIQSPIDYELVGNDPVYNSTLNHKGHNYLPLNDLSLFWMYSVLVLSWCISLQFQQ